jgi:hypothetical protein
MSNFIAIKDEIGPPLPDINENGGHEISYQRLALELSTTGSRFVKTQKVNL